MNAVRSIVPMVVILTPLNALFYSVIGTFRLPNDNPDKVMSGADVKALLKACGLTAKEAGERIGRSQNMMTTYMKEGCDRTPAMALAALASGLPMWSLANEPAFAAVRALIPALSLKNPKGCDRV